MQPLMPEEMRHDSNAALQRQPIRAMPNSQSREMARREAEEIGGTKPWAAGSSGMVPAAFTTADPCKAHGS